VSHLNFYLIMSECEYLSMKLFSDCLLVIVLRQPFLMEKEILDIEFAGARSHFMIDLAKQM
jgi:hypothetical protein